MNTYIITIIETSPESSLRTATGIVGNNIIEIYKRRVEMPDVNAVIDRLDAALKFRARKPRSDAGQTRKPATA